MQADTNTAVSEISLRDVIARQEDAITELTERLRKRDVIMEQAIQESEALTQVLKEMYLRMVRTRMTRP